MDRAPAGGYGFQGRHRRRGHRRRGRHATVSARYGLERSTRDWTTLPGRARANTPTIPDHRLTLPLPGVPGGRRHYDPPA